MSHVIDIAENIGKCPRTDLDRVARFSSLTVNSNGFVQIHYTKDTLDKTGEVFQQGTEIQSVTYHPQPISTPEGIIQPVQMPEEIAALVSAVSPHLSEVLKALNQEAGDEQE